MIPIDMTPDSFDTILTLLIQKHNLAVDELTEKQLADTLRQALQCGDFIRLVRVDNGAQQVVYIPFEREQELSLLYTRLRSEVGTAVELLELFQNYNHGSRLQIEEAITRLREALIPGCTWI